MTSNSDLKRFLAAYPQQVEGLTLGARSVVLAAAPQATEMLDAAAKIIGYGFGSGYKGLICTLILSQAEVKLGIVRAVELPDPKNLMEGTGKTHRYIRIRTAADLKKPGLKPLLKAAVKAARKRSESGSHPV